MKLAYIKLLNRYRSLPAGFEMRFDTETPQLDKVSPICFVGRNGSGKSNVMEFLTEVFYYLETLAISPNRESIKMQLDLCKDLGFELTIKYDKGITKYTKQAGDFLLNIENEEISVKGEIQSKKSANWSWRDYTRVLNDVMPRKVIGYSSGMNELLSNPFLRMQFQYYEDYILSVREKLNQGIDISRLFYTSYQTNESVLIANYLIETENTEGGKPFNPLKVINDQIRTKDIDSFRIEIETEHLLPVIEVNDEEIPIDEPLEAESIIKLSFDGDKTVWLLNPFLEDIENLKKCATSYHEIHERIHRQVIDGVECEYPIKRLILDFKVNAATKAAFSHYFGSPQTLFELLNKLTLLNIHAFTPEQQKTVKDAERDFNISSFLPRIAKDALIFHISDLKMVKDSGEEIPYSGLSDGEHQYMHIIGTAILMNEPNTLFLLDEPETHFNPMWRAKFVSTLNKITGDVAEMQQVFILTTHSPFVLSDCRAENVWRFNSDDKEIAKSMATLDIKTYGTSFEALLSDAFGKEESVSEMANEYILELYKEPSDTLEEIELIKDKAYELGDSVEKTMLIDYLNRKKRSFQNKVSTHV
jgi:restriction system-associated AAA family ATPase